MRTLGKVRLGAIVVKLEQGGTSLDRCLDHTRRSDFGDSLDVESFSEGAKKNGTESHDGSSGLTTKFEMAQISSDRVVSVLEVS